MNLQYYNVTKEKSVLSLQIPESVIGDEHRTLSLFICLDISGSMSGAPIVQAKEAILQIIEGLVKRGVLTEKDITCFFFQSSCEEKIFGDHDDMLLENGEIKNYFNKVRAGGGTNFSAVFDSIIKNLDRINNDLAIIFFTDGQDSGNNNLDKAKIRLETALKRTSYATEVHSIGFSKDHDAELLLWLTRCGRKEGNFLYVKSSDEILQKMKTTLQLLELSDRTFDVKIGDREPLQAHFDDQGLAILILTGEDNKVEGKQVTILEGSKKQVKYKFETTPSQVPVNDPTATQLTIFFIQREIIRLTNEISNNSKEDKSDRFNQILIEVKEYEEQLNVISQTISETKSKSMNGITQQCSVIQSLVHKFMDILSAKLNGTLTNEQIAEFSHQSYIIISQQKLDKRIISNRFCQKLCQDFTSFFEQKKFCDVTIKIGSSPNIQEFEANSCILYARSPFFRKALSSDATNHVIEIPDISPKEFEELLRYIYCGSISFDNKSSEIFELLLAAVKLELEEVVNYLQPQLTKYHYEWLSENFTLICRMNQQYGILVDLFANVIKKTLEKFQSKDFYKVKEHVLVELLKCDQLKMDELEIWKLVLKWGLAKHPSIDPDPKGWKTEVIETLTETFKDLLPLVRFFQLSSEQFCKGVRPYKKLLPEDLYEDLISYYMIPGHQPTYTMVLPPRQ